MKSSNPSPSFFTQLGHFVFSVCLLFILAAACTDYSFNDFLDRISNALNNPSNERVNGSLSGQDVTSNQCPSVMAEIGEKHRPLEVRDYVVGLVRHPGNISIESACDVLDYLSQWMYIPDPVNTNLVADPDYSFRYRRGDCDDYSTVVSSSLAAIGATTRIIVEKSTSGGYHAYPEMLLPDHQTLAEVTLVIRQRYGLNQAYQPAHHIDQYGNTWINFDYSAAWPGGPYRGTGEGFIIQFPGNLCYRL